MNAALLRADEPSAKYSVSHAESIHDIKALACALGDVDLLRRLIVSLAVRGQLVPQDQSDEPASALLARISRTRVLGSSRGRLKEELGLESPPGWAWASLSQLGAFMGGKTPSTGRPEYWGGSTPWVTPKDMKSPRLQDAEDHVTEAGIAQGLSLVPARSVLVVVRSGILRRKLPVAIAERVVTINQDLKALALHDPSMTEYVAILLAGFEPFILASLTKVGTTVESVRVDDFAECAFPLPPLAEQKRIVARVEELMKLCDALEANGRLADEQHARLTSTLFETLTTSESEHALAENWRCVREHFDLLLDRPSALEALDRVLVSLALQGKLVLPLAADEPAEKLVARLVSGAARVRARRAASGTVTDEGGDQVPFPIPQTWTWARFADVARISSCLVQPTRHQDAWQVAPDCIEKATGRLLIRRTVREAGIKSANHSFRAGQILYSKIRPSLSKATVVDFDGLCSADMYPIDALVDTQFLLLVMLSGLFLEQVRDAENRVKMPKLNQESLKKFWIPVPPLAEQRRIVTRVEELRRLSNDLRDRLTRAREVQSRLADALVAQATA